MAAYFFQSPLDIDVKLDGEEARKQVEIKGEKERVSSCPVYYDGESVGGAVCLSVWSDPSSGVWFNVMLTLRISSHSIRWRSEFGMERN
jgi:Vacuolar protein sorting-associated protein 26